MKRALGYLNKMTYKKVVWLLANTETLHNAEEAFYLPDWSKIAGLELLKIDKF